MYNLYIYKQINPTVFNIYNAANTLNNVDEPKVNDLSDAIEIYL